MIPINIPGDGVCTSGDGLPNRRKLVLRDTPRLYYRNTHSKF